MSLEAGDIATWYAAGFSTLLGIWEFYKWKKEGPQLLIDAFAEMIMVGNGTSDDGRFINIRITNVGTQPCTLTTLCGMAYKGRRIGKWKRKATYFIIPSTTSGPFNHRLLSPGDYWSAAFPQADLKEKYRDHKVFIGVYHSAKPRTPIYKRIEFKKD